MRYTNIINKIKGNKRILYLSFCIVLILFSLVLNITFSKYISNLNKSNANIVIGDLKYNMQVNNGALEDRVLKIPKNDTRIFTVLLTSLNDIDTKYELIYHVCKDVNCKESEYISKPDGLDVLVSSKTINGITDDIKKEESISISIAGTNESSDDYYIKLDLNVGYLHNELALIKQITKTYYEDDVTIISYVDGVETTEFPTTGNYGVLYECMVKGAADNNVVVTGIWDTTDANNYHWKIDVSGVTKSKTICNVTFVTRTLNSIKVTKNPTKMYYEPGETFDGTGMIVSGYFDKDGTETSVELSGYTVSPTTINTGSTKLTITYMDGDLPLTTTLNVNIKPKLTMDFNGGTGTDVSGYYEPGTSIALGTVTKSGVAFAGWEVVSGDVTITDNKFTIGSSNVSVKATYQQTWNFGYTGGSQSLTTPYSGVYKLEVWGGAGGGSNGGKGGYSGGYIKLENSTTLYVYVGGASSGNTGGYNGGGNGKTSNNSAGYGGGGATHIAFTDGILSNLETLKEKIIMVAGGGGGGIDWNSYAGGYGGGIQGGTAYSYNNSFVSNGGTQTTGYAFGLGQTITATPTYVHSGYEGRGGGGGGYYGGYGQNQNGAFSNSGGAGGSGYIGYSNLYNKVMYCYNCTASSVESTKTVSTTCLSSTPTSNCAKQGSGYARITFISPS